jgi:N-acyl-D-aspartate/D-glutamate deacylase
VRALLLALCLAGVGACDGDPAPPTAVASAAGDPEPPPTASAAASSNGAAERCWEDGSCPPSSAAPYGGADRVDVHIAGGTVVDGSGAFAVKADVLIAGDRIVHVGPVPAGVDAKRRIDASGKVVTPGFIDTHAHGDPEQANANALAMGVTTLCVGQDGKSPSDDRIRTWARRLAGKRLAVNVAPFAGHGTLRGLAHVGISPNPTPKQLERVVRLVASEMDAGAWGLTTGLEYHPGSFAGADELAALAKPVAERDGVIMSHLRSEDDDKIDAAIDELLGQGRAGARVHVAHIKVVYGKGVARAEALLAKLAAARAEGIEVTADIYPYEASYTTINIVFPDFALPPHSWKRVRRERRDELAQFLRDKVTRRGGPEATLFGTDPWRGMTLAAVAAKLGKPFEEVLIDDIGPGKAAAAYFVMDEALQSRLLLDPALMIGTDGSSASRHPRGYGTFAKVIREHVVARKALTLREAIRKMSGLAAATVGLDRVERGLLKAGWAADVLVFDPRAVADAATYEEPHKLAKGMAWVIVNGVVTIDEGKRKNRRGGRVVLRPRSDG